MPIDMEGKTENFTKKNLLLFLAIVIKTSFFVKNLMLRLILKMELIKYSIISINFSKKIVF